LPPEVLGLNALDKDDLRFVKEIYVNFEEDLSDALKYLNRDTGFLPKNIARKVNDLSIDLQPDREHNEITASIASSLKENEFENLQDCILRAANLRKFLG
jgi:phosphoenolpyruvate carboxylase